MEYNRQLTESTGDQPERQNSEAEDVEALNRLYQTVNSVLPHAPGTACDPMWTIAFQAAAEDGFRDATQPGEEGETIRRARRIRESEIAHGIIKRATGGMPSAFIDEIRGLDDLEDL